MPGAPGYNGSLPAPALELRANILGPEKFINRHNVDRDRDGEQHRLSGRDPARPVADEEEKHPREQNHGVTIGELPAARIAVEPAALRAVVAALRSDAA